MLASSPMLHACDIFIILAHNTYDIKTCTIKIVLYMYILTLQDFFPLHKAISTVIRKVN